MARTFGAGGFTRGAIVVGAVLGLVTIGVAEPVLAVGGPTWAGTKCTRTEGDNTFAVIDGRAADPDGVKEWHFEATWDSVNWETAASEEDITPAPTTRRTDAKANINSKVEAHGGKKPIKYRIRVKDAEGNEETYDPVALECVVDPANPVGANGSGIVTGTIAVSPGVPLDPTASDCSGSVAEQPYQGTENQFEFGSTVATGTFAVSDGTSATVIAATVNIAAQGTGTCESPGLGSGPVTVTACEESTAVVIADTTPGVVGSGADVACSLQGDFLRIGTHLLVRLAGAVDITTVAQSYSVHMKVEVIGELLGTAQNSGCPSGATLCVQQADLAGTLVAHSTGA